MEGGTDTNMYVARGTDTLDICSPTSGSGGTRPPPVFDAHGIVKLNNERYIYPCLKVQGHIFRVWVELDGSHRDVEK